MAPLSLSRLRLGPIIAAVLVILSLALAGITMLTTDAVAAEEPFAIKNFTMQTTGPPVELLGGGGLLHGFVNEPYAFTQAAGHPYALTTTVEVTSEERKNAIETRIVPTRDPKDIVTDLPTGLLGNPMAVPRCPLTQVLDKDELCPNATQIGVAVLRVSGGSELLGPIVNVTPEAGQSAEFALENTTAFTYVLTAHLVRTAGGYGFTVASNGIPITELFRAELTFWGTPADPSHDRQRGLLCERKLNTSPFSCGGHEGRAPSGIPPVPFLTMPTDCAAGLETATISADSWEAPGKVGVNGQMEGYVHAQTAFPTVAGQSHGMTGCNLLNFEPSIELQPDTLVADEPVGLGFNLRVPQPEQQQQSATPHLRDAVVTLPEGMSVSPGVVDGIQACDESGPTGINFTGPESEQVGPNGELQLAPGHCPDASIVGTAEAITPLLPEPVQGHLYLARPGCGGAGQRACTEQDALNGNLYKLYLELGGVGALGNTGIEIKVEGKTEANPATGQLTTMFLGNPQAPFSELKLHLNGGPRAPIDNPSACGPAVTTSDFTPWSASGITPEGLQVAGTPDATPSSFFDVAGCSNPPAFKPGFLSGTVTPQAGQFSAFTLELTRKDREQYVKGIQVHTPPGLIGMLSSVPLCGATEAEAGTCPESSKIGTTRVASGAGSHPFEIEGNVYLTGPYRNAPFGLSIVTDAVAGPFNLGLVVVRARIEVDQDSSTLTVTTDETGPHAVPQIIFGVPLRLQRITVNINRPSFMFNPTDCNAQEITASVSGSQDTLAKVESPFAVGGCRSLAFKPKFTVSTNAHTNRRQGASLDAKVAYPPNSFGNEANVASVKVSLPRQLPSRLSTLQHACPAATFNANPAACPAASIVGIARARTPVLPVLLQGPAYFVSHGGEAFPSLIVVLQGEHVRVDLTGTTFISKANITSSTFKTVPDVPVQTFELYLPQGRFSALAAIGNLCTEKKKLLMPTAFVGQNGARFNQQTKLQVVGCKSSGAAKKGKK